MKNVNLGPITFSDENVEISDIVGRKLNEALSGHSDEFKNMTRGLSRNYNSHNEFMEDYFNKLIIIVSESVLEYLVSKFDLVSFCYKRVAEIYSCPEEGSENYKSFILFLRENLLAEIVDTIDFISARDTESFGDSLDSAVTHVVSEVSSEMKKKKFDNNSILHKVMNRCKINCHCFSNTCAITTLSKEMDNGNVPEYTAGLFSKYLSGHLLNAGFRSLYDYDFLSYSFSILLSTRLVENSFCEKVIKEVIDSKYNSDSISTCLSDDLTAYVRHSLTSFIYDYLNSISFYPGTLESSLRFMLITCPVDFWDIIDGTLRDLTKDSSAFRRMVSSFKCMVAYHLRLYEFLDSYDATLLLINKSTKLRMSDYSYKPQGVSKKLLINMLKELSGKYSFFDLEEVQNGTEKFKKLYFQYASTLSDNSDISEKGKKDLLLTILYQFYLEDNNHAPYRDLRIKLDIKSEMESSVTTMKEIITSGKITEYSSNLLKTYCGDYLLYTESCMNGDCLLNMELDMNSDGDCLLNKELDMNSDDGLSQVIECVNYSIIKYLDVEKNLFSKTVDKIREYYDLASISNTLWEDLKFYQMYITLDIYSGLVQELFSKNDDRYVSIYPRIDAAFKILVQNYDECVLTHNKIKDTIVGCCIKHIKDMQFLNNYEEIIDNLQKSKNEIGDDITLLVNSNGSKEVEVSKLKRKQTEKINKLIEDLPEYMDYFIDRGNMSEVYVSTLVDDYLLLTTFLKLEPVNYPDNVIISCLIYKYYLNELHPDGPYTEVAHHRGATLDFKKYVTPHKNDSTGKNYSNVEPVSKEEFEETIQVICNNVVNENGKEISLLTQILKDYYMLPDSDTETEEFKHFLKFFLKFVCINMIDIHESEIKSLNRSYLNKDIKDIIYNRILSTEDDTILEVSSTALGHLVNGRSNSFDEYFNRKGTRDGLILKMYDAYLLTQGEYFVDKKVKYSKPDDIKSLLSVTYLFNKIDRLDIGPNKYLDIGEEVFKGCTPVLINNQVEYLFSEIEKFLDKSFEIDSNFNFIRDDNIFITAEDCKASVLYRSKLFNSVLEIFSFEFNASSVNEILSNLDLINSLGSEEIIKKFNITSSRDSIVQFASNMYCMISNYGKRKEYDFGDATNLKTFSLPDMRVFKLFKKLNISIDKFRELSSEAEVVAEAWNTLDAELFYTLFSGLEGYVNLFKSVYHSLYVGLANVILQSNGLLSTSKGQRELNPDEGNLKVSCIVSENSSNANKLNNNLSKKQEFSIKDETRFMESPILLGSGDMRKMFIYATILAKLSLAGSRYITISPEALEGDYVDFVREMSLNLSDNNLDEIEVEDFYFILDNLTFNFEFIFNDLKICFGDSPKHIDLNNYKGKFFERLGESLTIYDFEIEQGKLKITNEFFMDYITEFRFKISDNRLVEENVYSVQSDSLKSCGSIGRKISETLLTDVSKHIFMYVFYSVLFLERDRLKALVEDVKNHRVTINDDELVDKEYVEEETEEELVEGKKFEEDKSVRKQRDNSNRESITIRKNSLTEEELKLIESIDPSIMDNFVNTDDLSGIKVISLNSLFTENMEKVFKGQKSLERVKPNYRLKSWTVKGHTRTYKSGKQVYIEPRKAHRNSELLSEDSIDFQQKIINEGSLFKGTNLFKEL